MRTCECGCGQETDKRFVHGHNGRLNKKKLKTCTKCKKKTYERLAQKMCKTCYDRFYYKNMPDEKKKEISSRSAIGNKVLRNLVLDKLGSKCQCCGEDRREFLTIDHVQGGGCAHRRACGGSIQVYRRIRDEGYPRNKYQVLCWNCNASMGHLGYCPHGNLPIRKVLCKGPGKKAENV